MIGFVEDTKLSKAYPFVDEKYFKFDLEIGSDRAEVVRYHRALSILDDLLYLSKGYYVSNDLQSIISSDEEDDIEL